MICSRPVMYDSSHAFTIPESPYEVERRSRRIPWSTVSKRRTYIEEGKEGDLILIDGRVDFGENSEYGCLCGMISAESGLEFWKQTISRQANRGSGVLPPRKFLNPASFLEIFCCT